ncbi:hemolysin [Deltaproteobacteria bacterium]|nr:hemolysin [Deltaproteobacteria bacterium]
MSAFFATSEAALFSLQRVDREALKDDASIGEAIRHLLAQPRRLLAALLMGSEAANIALSSTSAQLAAEAWPDWPGGRWVNIAIVAPIIILFADIMPKTLGIRFARPVARVVVRPLQFWNELVSPVRFVLTSIADGFLRLLGVQPPKENEGLQEVQLRTLIDQGLQVGVIQPMEQEIIHRVFEFGDLPVSRVMTPRPDVFSLSITTPWPELIAKINEFRYSRVPLWQGSPENIVGILLMKDLIRFRSGPPPNARQLQKVLHPTMFVPPSKRAQDLLREFRHKNMHLAVVVDEHGSSVGLVTLDDLLTELVGAVHDESDAVEKDSVELSPGLFTVQAGMDVDDFSARFGVELPEGEYTTLGGFVFHLLGRAPEKGDEVAWEGRGFKVSGLEGRRITEVTVNLGAPPPEVVE